MSIDTQAGFVDESTYGTAVTVTKFFPLISESIREDVSKLESEARRSGLHVQRSDISIPIYKGSAGSVEIPIMSKDFGWWLKHLTGAVATAGPTDSGYTHTGTVGTLKGDSFSAQFNRPFHDSGSNQPFSYEGGKVASWEISCGVDQEAKLSADLDFENVATGTALASASYPAGLELLSWAHAESLLTIAGTTVPVTEFTVGCDNGLKLDRHYVRGSALKKEPVADKYREITWSLTADFDSLTQYNRFKAATNAGQYAEIVVALKAPTLIGATTYPGLTITIPAARFDEIDVDNSSTDPNMQTLSGVARYDGTNSPITLAYVTTQSTP